MRRPRVLLLVLGGLAASAAVASRVYHRAADGRRVPGGTLIGDARAYDRLSHRILLGSFFEGIAADIGANVAGGERVLEVGCGPGHLAIRMARQLGLDVTGLDLDPDMIDVARENVARAAGDDGRKLTFVVGDVASQPFLDGSFDLVVSTLSMHHWEDASAGLAEIGRVLAPGGRALIWDIRRGAPLHAHAPDPVEQAHLGPLRVVSTMPWRWPWGISLTHRIELARAHHPDPGGPVTRRSLDHG